MSSPSPNTPPPHSAELVPPSEYDRASQAPSSRGVSIASYYFNSHDSSVMGSPSKRTFAGAGGSRSGGGGAAAAAAEPQSSNSLTTTFGGSSAAAGGTDPLDSPRRATPTSSSPANASPQRGIFPELAGTGEQILHRRNSSVNRHNEAASSDLRGPLRDQYSAWASGLDLGGSSSSGAAAAAGNARQGHLQESSQGSEGPRFLDNPFEFEEEEGNQYEDGPPQIILSHFGDGGGENTVKHSRGESAASAAPGDVGRIDSYRPYPSSSSMALHQQQEGMSNLSLGLDSPSQTPTMGGSGFFFNQGDGDHDETEEEAVLTSHQAHQGDWDQFGARAPFSHTPPTVTPSPEDERVPHSSSRFQHFDVGRVDSPSNLEDGQMKGQGGEGRVMFRSSAEVYASAGGDAPGVQRARSNLQKVGKSIRRISRRVVDLDGQQQRQRGPHVRLEEHERRSDEDESEDEALLVAAPSPAARAQSPFHDDMLRGKSLGIFAPESRLRQALATGLKQWWIEPLILALIVLNAVLLVIQSAPSVFKYPRKPGYFDYWVDYALLAVFGIFTLEVLARIIVSGLIINPPPPVYQPTSTLIIEEPKALTGQSSSAPRVVVLDEQGGPNEDKAGGAEARLMKRTKKPRPQSRSNTLDTFAEMGDTLKTRAHAALAPHREKEGGSITPPRSPNRTDFSTSTIKGPRTATSEYVRQVLDGSSEPAFAHDMGETSQANRGAADGKTAPKTQGTSSKVLRQGSELIPFSKIVSAQRQQTTHYAYLRHSWNRIDFVAVLAFWTMFILCIFRQEMTPSHHLFIFRAISILRCARLLTVTSGTTTILQSLKTAGPLLVNVAFFIVFAMLLFSIIGIQSFRGSYRRNCIWVGDNFEDPGTNFTLSQICGGFYDMTTGQTRGRVNEVGRTMSDTAKGFICPRGQICVESNGNPESNTQSFDNIFTSLLQVVIVISSNNWSNTMYDMIDADYFASCLYFILGLIIMNFWMANLFVAVITNTFASISAATKQSAFAAKSIEQATKPRLAPTSETKQRRQRVADVYKRIWRYTRFFWLALVVADLGVQASQASYHTKEEKNKTETAEIYITAAFDVEIILRFLSFLLDNDWRGFFMKRRNKFDLFLAVITSIILIPAIKNSNVYPWLTAFQLARFYRVIAAVPRMEALLIRVFGSMSGLFNMILFLILMVGLASLMAAQLLRGDIPAEDDSGDAVEMNFKQIYNSFLAMYQIFSSEDWTTPLFSALSNEGQYQQAVIAGIFLGGWFLFANFIVLQMFIAVIGENFGVAEGQKKQQQLEMYLRKMEKPDTSLTGKILHQLSPYRWLRERNEAKIRRGAPKTQGSRAAADAEAEKSDRWKRKSLHGFVSQSRFHRVMNLVAKALRLDRPEEQVPLDTLRARQFRQSFSGGTMLSANGRPVSVMHLETDDDAARLFARERQLTRMRTDLGLSGDNAPDQAEIDHRHANRYNDDPRIAQARLINTHPSYEKSLWIFSNTNAFRRFCQSIVPPSHGQRLFGRQPVRFRMLVYQATIFAAIAASVVVAGYATPLYRRQWYGDYGFRRDSWFSVTEVSLSIFFILEFLIKVIADGFAFTPNAYLLSPWNALDLFVLLTLLVNVITELVVIGGVSRFTRALKALRALRLINLSGLMRSAFSALLHGSGRFVDASVLAILYIVPFAIWGQNLFSGLLYSCTDGSDAISTKADCLGEYSTSPSEWSFLAPRVWQNPTEGSIYSFDDFKSSLLILFEIVSLEGWISVMTTAMSIVGRDKQLSSDNSQVNALFFVVYNLLGAVFVLTLFVAVIIESFQKYSGAAYLTTAQRQWIDLRRLISRQRPSKRPKVRPTGRMRSWCYDRAVHKHGWWSRVITFLYFCSIIVLATQRYGDAPWVERIRDIIFLCFTAIFTADILVRLIGLGWQSYRQNVWNLFDLVVVTGTLATTVPLLRPGGQDAASNVQLQKIFLTAVAFKLVQRSNSLNQLFKTAVASLPSIASLFLLWLTMFLVWGIMLVEVFGLTKWGENETYQKNFSTLLGSLVFLSMMSTGEGWNQYMHDYTLSPPECTPSASYLDTDCGSEGWAYFLFVTWNVISMYIFLNMFTGTVVENFSYVFQLGGKPTLSREQVRNFKKAWATTDVQRKGYLTKEQLVPFFNRLTGILDVKVYRGETTIAALLNKADARGKGVAAGSASGMPLSPSIKERLPLGWPRSPIGGGGGAGGASSSMATSGVNEGKGHFMWPPSTPSSVNGGGTPLASPSRYVVDGVDIEKLRRALSERVDAPEIMRRRARFERLYQEACLRVEENATPNTAARRRHANATASSNGGGFGGFFGGGSSGAGIFPGADDRYRGLGDFGFAGAGTVGNDAMPYNSNTANIDGGGIRFHEMLELLAHYKLIDDDEALSLEELMQRRMMMERVEDRIQLEKVRSVLRGMWIRRKYVVLKRFSQQEPQLPLSTLASTSSIPIIQVVEDGEPERLHTKRSVDLTSVDASFDSPSRGIGKPSLKLDVGGAPQQHPPSSPQQQYNSLSVASGRRPSAATSSSRSLDELEREASPVLEQISKGSAWGAIGRRLSTHEDVPPPPVVHASGMRSASLPFTSSTSSLSPSASGSASASVRQEEYRPLTESSPPAATAAAIPSTTTTTTMGAAMAEEWRDEPTAASFYQPTAESYDPAYPSNQRPFTAGDASDQMAQPPFYSGPSQEYPHRTEK